MTHQIYTMEDLLPAAAMLADKYTSKESSSVTYETAQRLMEAVIYCVEESADEWGDLPAAQTKGSGADVWTAAYRRGYERVLAKTRRAKAVYEEVIADFEDYGCRNYRDTVLKGIPAFFVRYDPVFAPQDHLLTLDYPELARFGGRQEETSRGVDRILEYLMRIHAEQLFLACFPAGAVAARMRQIPADYGELYLDNLCAPMLLRAAGCVLAGRPVRALSLDDVDYQKLECGFEGKDRAQTAAVVREVIVGLAGAAFAAEDADPLKPGGGAEADGRPAPEINAAAYLSSAAEEFAARIENALKNNCLDRVI